MSTECDELGKFTKRRVEYHVMYGFVRGVLCSFPAVSVDRAIEIFAKEFGVGESFNQEAARKEYFRMRREVLGK